MSNCCFYVQILWNSEGNFLTIKTLCDQLKHWDSLRSHLAILRLVFDLRPHGEDLSCLYNFEDTVKDWGELLYQKVENRSVTP